MNQLANDFLHEQLFARALHAQESGDLPAAAGIYAQILEKWPGAQAANNLGNVMLSMGHVNEARACFTQALALNPAMLEARYNLARVDQMTGRLEAAEAGYAEVLSGCRLEQAAYNRAIVLRDMGKLDEAAVAYEALLTWAPNHANAWNNLGKARREQGDVAGAVAAFDNAVRYAQEDAEIASNRLFCLLHDEMTDAEALFSAQRVFAERFEAPLRAHWRGFENDKDVLRPLRVGFVSGDLRDHPVGRFLLPLLEHLDPAQMTAVAFSNAPVEDVVSERMKACVSEWHTIFGVDDGTVSEFVRQRQIDILIDLSGHTAGNRLGVFARKPAPVQAAWLGYLGSTGLRAMDWRITDAACDSPWMDQWHTERLARMPYSQWCYRPPRDVPLPEMRLSSEIRLGAFVGAAKISESALTLWGRLLADLPFARLLLVGVPPGQARQRIATRFSASGVRERFSFLDRMPIEDYLRQMGQVDIMLDSFPYAGGTTSCDVLWMGVPVVSLAGSRSSSRSGASLLPLVGLADWVASNTEEYAGIVRRWANAPDELRQLRTGLRGRMEKSPLMDETGFARDWMAMIRTLWQDWVQRG